MLARGRDDGAHRIEVLRRLELSRNAEKVRQSKWPSQRTSMPGVAAMLPAPPCRARIRSAAITMYARLSAATLALYAAARVIVLRNAESGAAPALPAVNASPSAMRRAPRHSPPSAPSHRRRRHRARVP